MGPGLFVPVFHHISVFGEMADIFETEWRSEITGGLPWIQSALLERSFEWLCSDDMCMECPYI